MDSTLSSTISSIHELSDSPTNLKQLLGILQQREDQLIQMLPELDGAMQALTPAAHTLGLVFILHYKAAAVPLSQPQAVHVFMGQCRRMLLGCDPQQVQMVPSQFVAVCTKFTASAIALKSPLAAVAPLRVAARALQPTPSHFTPLHAEFLKVCILSKCYFAAQALLEHDLLQVDRDATLVAPRDLLLYHYYGGIVQTGLKQYRSAIQYFTLCISAPTQVLNTIMIEAYKKCLPCSLVETGKVPKLPKYTSPTITRAIKNQLPAYTEFAEAFSVGNGAELQAALDKHVRTFTEDRNLGLAKRCLAALVRRSVHALTETYLTLSLPDIAQKIKLPVAAAAESTTRDMIVSGEIHASIDEDKGMVLFRERSEQYDSKDSLVAMEAALGKAISLASRLHELHGSLSVDQNYLMRMSTHERSQPQFDEDAMLLSK